MPRKAGLGLLAVLLLVSGAQASGNDFFNLPTLPPPEGYGVLMINRVSRQRGMEPVMFSHWQHRMKFTCRVCHGELDFNTEVNTTGITELANRKGRFCGACHNGKVAFKSNGNCNRCHTTDVRPLSKKFNDMTAATPFPRSGFGNGVDWMEALRSGMISPRTYLKEKSEDLPFDKELLLEAGWSMIPPSVFSHKAHTRWLDCGNCHPDVFNIKQKTTQHFSMAHILRGRFCGACHLNTAFPMNDCERCHPKTKEAQ